MTHHFRSAVAVSALSIFTVVGSLSAVAQTTPIDAEIEARLAAAEIQVEALGDVLGVPVQVAQALPDGYAAQVELRLGQLEQSLRQILGQVEQLQFENRTMNDRLERALNDIEFRLSELEGGGSGGSSSTTGSLGPAVPSPSTPPVTTGGGTTTAAPPTAGTLGSLGVTSGTDGAAPGSDEAARTYNDAFALMQAGNFDGAQRGFSGFVLQYPNNPLASNAQYWLGETLFAQGQFEAAANAFSVGYRRYPTGSKAMDSLFKLGLSLTAISRNREACSAFSQLLISFPTAPPDMAQRARDELARLQCG
ncbi:MAG: tol-pal system protein YbgF [Pseudomonadota bacterium]